MGTLITCQTCGGSVSSNARSCPHCGERSPEAIGERIKYTLLGLAALGIAAVLAAALVMLVLLLGW